MCAFVQTFVRAFLSSIKCPSSPCSTSTYFGNILGYAALVILSHFYPFFYIMHHMISFIRMFWACTAETCRMAFAFFFLSDCQFGLLYGLGSEDFPRRRRPAPPELVRNGRDGWAGYEKGPFAKSSKFWREIRLVPGS